MDEPRTGRRIRLQNGIVYEDGNCGLSRSGNLYCYLPYGLKLTDVFPIFSDADNTGVIVYEYGDMDSEYVGYTELIGVDMAGDGIISVCLRKPGGD